MVENKKRILVADDEKTVHDFFMRLFASLNVEIVSAQDGKEAVALAQQSAFDMYFLDYRMPGFDGLEVSRSILRVYPDAKVVIITGLDADDKLKKAKEEGIIAVMHKPFDIHQLTDVFQKEIGKKHDESKKILVIDDDKVVLIFFANLLSNFEYGYKVASSKKEAVVALKEDKFDLIFLDLFVADATGIEIYEEIKKYSPEADVIVITGHREKAKELTEGMKLLGCLFKPFGVSEIISYITHMNKKK